jgi:carbonic anhydrase/acetyltransferase-like protein (isoleucine patch superfamily)
MGSPAKLIRELSDEEVAELYASASRYVEFKSHYQK